MPPAACSRRRNATALKPPRFPILAFDELRLRLAAGIVFDLKWLVPGESLVSMLWKFCSANALAPDWLVQQMSPDVDPSVGVVPVRDVISITRMHRLLRLPENVMRASLLDTSLPGRYHPTLRYCRQCAAHGYHCVLYQFKDEDRCPVHQQPLETRCLSCGKETPYVINTEVLGAPLRCVSCHSHFSYGRLSLLSTIPAMRRQDRAAISRRVLLRSGDTTGERRPEQSVRGADS